MRLKNCTHRVHTSMYHFILIVTDMYTYTLLDSFRLWYVLVCPGMYQYIPMIPLRTRTVFILSKLFPVPCDNGGHATMYFRGKACYSMFRLKPYYTAIVQVYRILRELSNNVFCTGMNWYVLILWRFMAVYSGILNFSLRILYT